VHFAIDFEREQNLFGIPNLGLPEGVSLAENTSWERDSFLGGM